jgi:hypothetical protein
MSQTLRFNPGGHIDCLYTEAIDLHALGRLQVVRATDIRFDDSKQQWDVRDADKGTVIFSHPSRNECLRWEHKNLQPQASPSQTETKNQNLKIK